MRQITLISNILFSLLSTVVFLSPLIPPSFGWIFGFTAFLLPVFIILNFLHFAFLLLKRSYFVIMPGVLLLWSFQYIPVTWSFHQDEVVDDSVSSFSVLSYNTKYFQRTHHWHREIYLNPDANQSAIQGKKWLQSHPTDIVCLQEFYNDPKSEFYDFVRTLKLDSTYSVYLSGTYHQKLPILTTGLAIISKYPIVRKGEIFVDRSNWNNRGIYADIDVDSDTVRIINVHLHSMKLDPVIQNNSASLFQMANYTYQKVKNGLLIREKQSRMVLDFVEKSPYPVIVTGDFNEIPYGYVYHTFSEHLENAFEEAGNGFGFTMNNKIPYFRIDHQFYEANSLDVVSFNTFREIKTSDHYPIRAIYRFIK